MKQRRSQEEDPKKKKKPPVVPLSKNAPQKSMGKTPYPDSFEITESMRAWAEQLCPFMDVDRTTEQWADSMQANTQKYQYSDWQAAWRNGMRFAYKHDLMTLRSSSHANEDGT